MQKLEREVLSEKRASKYHRLHYGRKTIVFKSLMMLIEIQPRRLLAQRLVEPGMTRRRGRECLALPADLLHMLSR
jgi:hypothetical protein